MILEHFWTWFGFAPKPPTPFLEPFPEHCWTWPGFTLLRNPIESDLKLHQNLLQIFFWNPIEPWSDSAPMPPDLFRNLLRNFLRNLLRNPIELQLTQHQTLHNLFWSFLQNPVEPDLALYQIFPEAFPDSCWTSPGFALKLPGFFSGNFAESCWIWPGTFFCILLNLTWYPHQCTPELFWIEDPISLRCREITVFFYWINLAMYKLLGILLIQ